MTEQEAQSLAELTERYQALNRQRAALIHRLNGYYDTAREVADTLEPWLDVRRPPQTTPTVHHDFSALPAGGDISKTLAELHKVEHQASSTKDPLRKYGLLIE